MLFMKHKRDKGCAQAFLRIQLYCRTRCTAVRWYRGAGSGVRQTWSQISLQPFNSCVNLGK